MKANDKDRWLMDTTTAHLFISLNVSQNSHCEPHTTKLQQCKWNALLTPTQNTKQSLNNLIYSSNFFTYAWLCSWTWWDKVAEWPYTLADAIFLAQHYISGCIAGHCLFTYKRHQCIDNWIPLQYSTHKMKWSIVLLMAALIAGARSLNASDEEASTGQTSQTNLINTNPYEDESPAPPLSGYNDDGSLREQLFEFRDAVERCNRLCNTSYVCKLNAQNGLTL